MTSTISAEHLYERFMESFTHSFPSQEYTSSSDSKPSLTIPSRYPKVLTLYLTFDNAEISIFLSPYWHGHCDGWHLKKEGVQYSEDELISLIVQDAIFEVSSILRSEAIFTVRYEGHKITGSKVEYPSSTSADSPALASRLIFTKNWLARLFLRSHTISFRWPSGENT